MEGYKRGGGDLQSASHWGRYNLNYRESEPSQVERTLPCNPAANRLVNIDYLSVPRAAKVQRHASDCDTRRLQPPRPTVTRHESDRQVICRDRDAQLVIRPLEARPSSCLRLSIIRSESDSRKKKVAFADSPSVIWGHGDDRCPAESTAGQGSSKNSSSVTTADARCAETAHSSSSAAGFLGSNRTTRSGTSSRDAEKQVLTPKERRRRKVAMAVVCTTFILLTASALFVLITLFNASAIDEAGKTPRNIDGRHCC